MTVYVMKMKMMLTTGMKTDYENDEEECEAVVPDQEEQFPTCYVARPYTS